MGERGPVRKPTQLRILEGNPSHRPLPQGEPTPKRVRPVCPDWLPAEAKRVWQREAQRLYRLGLFTELDGVAFEVYCLAYATLRQAQAVLDAKGLTFTTPSGYKQQRPEVAIVRNSSLLLRAMGAEFGLTPASRSRISLGEEAEAADGILS